MSIIASNSKILNEQSDLFEPSPLPKRTGKIRTLIVGAGTVGRQLAKSLEARGSHAIIGFVDDELAPHDLKGWEFLGRREATLAIVREHEIEEVVVAYAPTWQQRLTEELMDEYPHIDVSIVPAASEMLVRTNEIRHTGDIALRRIATGARKSTEIVKRLFDVTAAALSLILLSPVFLIVGLLIKLTSPGVVIFAQERIGRSGKPFFVYKFRTMYTNAENMTGPVLSSGKTDARLTKIGKWLRLFRIDELPQLWNVLNGTMSLVGPRPERPYFVQQFECTIPMYGQRHQARPGITGLAQVCGGYHTDARDKLRFDLYYVANQSLWLDLFILWRTVSVVLFPKSR